MTFVVLQHLQSSNNPSLEVAHTLSPYPYRLTAYILIFTNRGKGMMHNDIQGGDVHNVDD